ncbi:hypothetical protein [Acidithiobacillus ferrooxidans]|uniref:hypothetical protein n=1 Tax=Acidithiobacillus ferrooxidans TaxID=920 RepID=UPI000A85DDCC|nr:hypothetical protein [Acidithiobacillus ferrooxidans]
METYRGMAPQKLSIVEIGREDVQSMSTGTTVSFLNAFVRRHGLATLLREGLQQYSGSQGFLGFSFSGYDADRREIWEIPEVRNYVQSLLQDFPLFPFLLVDQAEAAQGQSNPLLDSGANLFFLTGIEPERPVSGRGGVMMSNRVFFNVLRTLAASATRQGVADFCAADAGLAAMLPGLVDTKSRRLFSQATGISVNNHQQASDFSPLIGFAM